MKNRNVKPNPAPARDAVILRVIAAHWSGRGAVTLELEPETVQVIDFYPQQRKRDGK